MHWAGLLGTLCLNVSENDNFRTSIIELDNLLEISYLPFGPALY